ncbi:MAG: SDR family NAD(P)-dependent oxidoreductase [Sulfuricaulis sp.]|nr:SDR family NAD(P)-dependent oxidoreductase [Sulfuricaulis sp.]
MSEKRVAVVTGAASGIGLAIAGSLAAAGMRVLLVDRDAAVRDRVRALADKGFEVDALVADLSREDEILGVARHIKASAGRCDVLVNNAGIHPKNKGDKFAMPEISLADFETVLRVNLSAPFLLCRELLPLMKANGWGRIVNIASRAGRTFIAPVGVHYSASKAGLIGMTRQIAGEFAAFGITANCIAPGRIETPLSSQSSPSIIEKAIQGIPAGRLGTTDEIAAVANFLASEGAGYVTGVVIDVNGGVFMS